MHHAIKPAFKAKTPYLILLVDLDTQKGQPTPGRGAARHRQPLHPPTASSPLPDLVKKVGIGTRVRMVFSDAGDGLSIPQWTIDEGAAQPVAPWRYAQE